MSSCSAVTEALGGLDDVRSVDVDLTAGRVTVVTVGEPDEALVSAAVSEAGYEVTGRAAAA